MSSSTSSFFIILIASCSFYCTILLLFYHTSSSGATKTPGDHRYSALIASGYGHYSSGTVEFLQGSRVISDEQATRYRPLPRDSSAKQTMPDGTSPSGIINCSLSALCKAHSSLLTKKREKLLDVFLAKDDLLVIHDQTGHAHDLIRPPEDTQPSIDVAALIQQLQKSPELATALAALLPHTS